MCYDHFQVCICFHLWFLLTSKWVLKSSIDVLFTLHKVYILVHDVSAMKEEFSENILYYIHKPPVILIQKWVFVVHSKINVNRKQYKNRTEVVLLNLISLHSSPHNIHTLLRAHCPGKLLYKCLNLLYFTL